MSTILRISGFPRRLKKIVSSMRLRNSGLNVDLQERRDGLLHVVDLRRVLDQLRADVARHDHQGVAEIHHPALAVGEPPLVQELEEHVETSGCAFSISSNRITEYGLRRTASVSWPPSS